MSSKINVRVRGQKNIMKNIPSPESSVDGFCAVKAFITTIPNSIRKATNVTIEILKYFRINLNRLSLFISKSFCVKASSFSIIMRA